MVLEYGIPPFQVHSDYFWVFRYWNKEPKWMYLMSYLLFSVAFIEMSWSCHLPWYFSCCRQAGKGERAAGTRDVNLALLILACLAKSLFTLYNVNICQKVLLLWKTCRRLWSGRGLASHLPLQRDTWLRAWEFPLWLVESHLHSQKINRK